eukprot:TRINITY_DN3548_c0_g1_i1.p1 TRINITY_DN3548_c0_g1~~TRINITY_DN3548_c0_g1_i1.p1  ORF type:complete len:946 (+),score=374.07 TRINITY_DN3548_c0_g1_i1:113-2950(+)
MSPATPIAPSDTTSQVEPQVETQVENPPAVPAVPAAPTQTIDPAFLEALPAELRDEILASQIGGTNANSAEISNSTLNPDFLAALPPDIAAEVLQNERQEQERRDREREAADPSHAEEMDNASFIATLPPDLREEILMTADEQLLQSLPPNLAAEAHAIRERHMRSRFNWRSRDFNGFVGEVPGIDRHAARDAQFNLNINGKPIISEDDLPFLLKVVSMQQTLSRNILHKTFLNLCAFEGTRKRLLSELIQSLVYFTSGRDSLDQPAKFQGDFKDQVDHMKTDDASAIIGFVAGLRWSTIYSPSSRVPNSVSRRFLEILAYLIKSNAHVAENLLESQVEKEKPFTILLDLMGNENIRGNSTHLEYLLSALSTAVKVLTAKKTAPTDAPAPPVAPAVVPAAAPAVAPAVEPSNDAMETNSTENKEKEKEKLVSPDFSQIQLENVVKVLNLNPCCSDHSFTYVTNLTQFLGTSESNKEILLKNLTMAAQSSSEVVFAEFEKLNLNLEKSRDQMSLVLTMIPTSFVSTELNFLRILKLMLNLAPAQSINANLKLEFLWESFENALNRLSKKSNSDPNTTSSLSPLLPIIEAFFAVNASVSVSTSITRSGQMPRFFSFVEHHRRLLNELIKQNPNLLQDSFSALLKTPHLIDFENKRSYFRSDIQRQKTDQDNYGELRITVRRNAVMEDSFYSLKSRKPEELKGRLSVNFAGEEGIDAGGLSREWYTILAREMFNPNYCLFLPTANSTFQPNKNSAINTDHLEFFKFVGRVIAKALYDGQLLDAHFTHSFYKHILGQPVSYTDMEAVDPEFYKSLLWILENDVSDLSLTFSTEQEVFGIVQAVELKENGRNIAVTDENKEEYVRLVTEMKMTTAIQQQIEWFKKGFHDLIKSEQISIFTPSELELLISGLPDIDIEDLRKNTEYRGYSKESAQIQWFWETVGDFQVFST